MKPGDTTFPVASIVSSASNVALLISAIVPFLIPMLDIESNPESGSIIRPPEIAISKFDICFLFL